MTLFLVFQLMLFTFAAPIASTAQPVQAETLKWVLLMTGNNRRAQSLQHGVGNPAVEAGPADLSALAVD